MSHDKLYNHVKDVLTLTLGDSRELFSIQIIDTDQEPLPFPELNSCISNQFLVLVTFQNNFDVGICTKLSSFISKQVKYLHSGCSPMVYWFEGEERFFEETVPLLLSDIESKLMPAVSRS